MCRSFPILLRAIFPLSLIEAYDWNVSEISGSPTIFSFAYVLFSTVMECKVRK